MELDGVDFGKHGIIYVTQEKDKPTTTEWTSAATEELLKILKKHYQVHGHSDGKLGSKRRLYEKCSSFMKKRGYRYAPTQCENKWKSLKRRFLTCYERNLTGKQTRRTSLPVKQMFHDEIEFILQYDRPTFKKDLEESKQNLNLPPGFEEVMDQNEENESEEEINDVTTYSPSDEQLVEMMLKDSADEDDKNTNAIEYLYPKAVKTEENSFKVETSATNDELLKEVQELTKAMKSNIQINTSLLKTHNATYEQMIVHFDSLDKKEDEKIELKRKKLEKQGELVQQMKIQNSLLAKIVQKLGTSSSGSGNK